MRKDRLLIKGKPTGTAKDEIVLQHMINKHSGKPIPYFIDEEDGRLKYLDKKTTDPKTGVVNYGYVDLTKKLEREARYQADKLKLTPDLKRFQKAFGKVKGQQIFLDELAKNDAIFDANNPDLFDIDHMGSKKFKYPHMARNFNPQLSAANRAEGARLLTSEQETALRVLRNDLDNTIKLQGPELTQAQKDKVLGRTKGGTTKNLIKKARNNAVKLGIGYAALNSQSAEAASSMLAGGANKEDTVKFFKGIGNDLTGQLTIAAASKLLKGAGTSLNGLSSTVAPLLIGWQGKQLGDSILRGANGEDLKSQGEISEAGKKYRKANGWSNGKSNRQNYRHGTSLKVNREMIDDYNLNNGKNDSEFYENYKFNQAMNKLMREQKKA